MQHVYKRNMYSKLCNLYNASPYKLLMHLHEDHCIPFYHIYLNALNNHFNIHLNHF